MEQFYVIANQYYLDFYSFKGYKKILWKKLLLSFLLSLMFLRSFMLVLGLQFSILPEFSQNMALIIMVVVELFFIASWYWTIKSKNRLALSVVSERLEVEVDSFENLKKEWLRKTFKQGPYEYLDIAERFTKAIELKNSDKPLVSLISKDEIFNMIINDSAKPRILALFLSLCSIVGVLILKEAGGFAQLIEAFHGVSLQELLVVDFILAVSLLFFLIALKFVFSLSYVLLTMVFYWYDGKRAQSDYIAKSLIRDLVYYHRTEVGKHLIEAE